ncbi:MAG: hypothetical protein IT416_02570 [Candidatus Pacebacteria bacterium]|nr:hypothetical protein [Candidatus Paceibacterota bacterium]
MLKKVTKLIPWLLSFGVILVVISRLIIPTKINQGMWYIFDDVHTVRTNEMVNELKNGQFPVRYLGNLAFKRGYLLFNFYSPLVYYLTSALVFIGKSPLNAVKNVFQLSYLIAGSGMFLLLKHYFPQKWFLPILGSILLISSPYFNYNIYTRGALAEVWGFALIPWLFLAYELIKKHKSNLAIVLFSVIASLMFYVHAISAFIAIPLLLVKFLIEWQITKQISKEIFKRYFLSFIVGVTLSASYLLPVIFEKNQVIYSNVEFVVSGFKTGFINFNELIGLSKNADPKIIPITLGKTLAISTLISIIIVFYRLVKKSQLKLKSELTTNLILIVITTFLLLKPSSFIWENNPLLQMTQFPYRFMILLTFLSILFIIITLNLVKNNFLKIIFGLVILLSSFYGNKIFYQPSGYYFAANFEAADLCATTTWQAEYLPKWTTNCATLNSPKQEVRVSTGEIEVTNSRFNSNNLEVEIETNGKSGTLEVDRYFYPGWQAKTFEKNLTIRPAENLGIIKIEVPENTELISLSFQDTLIRKIGNLLTLSSIISIIIIALIEIIKYKKIYLSGLFTSKKAA